MTLFGDFSPEYTRYENAAIIILPVPFDATSTWGKGADMGPQAILEASYNLEFYDIETDSEVFYKGIFTDQPIAEKDDPDRMVEEVAARVRGHLEAGKFIVCLGGEHSVSIGAIREHRVHYPDLHVLQLDAHTDLREEYHGSKNNHACVMARARERCGITQVGIRSMDSSEKSSLDPERVFFAKDIHDQDSWMQKAVSTLGETVYLTIDLDVFDPSVLPSTGTPEPGGLGWYPVLKFLRMVFSQKNIVGFDVVELSPNSGEKSSDFLAAKLIYTLLSYKFCLPGH